MPPKRKSSSSGSKAGVKALKVSQAKSQLEPTDASLVNILKCFVQSIGHFEDNACSGFPQSLEVASADAVNLGVVTLTLGESAKDFLSKMVEKEDTDSLSLLITWYTKSVVSVRLRWGDYGLRERGLGHYTKGDAFLPLLKFVKTEAAAKKLLKEFKKVGIDPEDYGTDGVCEYDTECVTIQDYLKEVYSEEDEEDEDDKEDGSSPPKERSLKEYLQTLEERE
ncbi:hypothetical protein CYMTET_39798 [Cymbomonas tetramitiformis]|uniref:Uncharacterized protein n=1 Tax=Cymbomonas tetramitiformis TaxID=36881 RepID=A0AAE0C9C7_9CHLO|nr:hypothetical protein CYMTET_39798 [Cymbomonas tetramitiformis]|eukprot:gene22915-27703_t